MGVQGMVREVVRLCFIVRYVDTHGENSLAAQPNGLGRWTCGRWFAHASCSRAHDCARNGKPSHQASWIQRCTLMREVAMSDISGSGASFTV